MDGSNQYQRYAFISYNHRDVKVAKWLHKKLESYKLPNEIHNEFEDSRYLRPVFRDQEDLNAGVLGDELRSKLESSKYLIVICSPYSAHSKWVSNEVKTFIEMGRLENIIPFIIDGIPGVGGAEECFPEYLCEFTQKFPDKELLCVNIQEVGREKSLVRIVSRMLEVDFDVLWKRHEREKRRKRVATCITLPILSFLIYFFVAPFSISIHLRDEKHNLPPIEHGMLVINDATYNYESLDTTIVVSKIPGYMRFHNIPYKAYASVYYDTIESVISVGLGIDLQQDIQMRRSDFFSIFSGRVMDEDGTGIEQALVEIEGKTTTTDVNGDFTLIFPLSEQTLVKRVLISKMGYIKKELQSESPIRNLKYILSRQ